MKFLIVVAAFLAVASANPEIYRQKRGIFGYSAPGAVIAGPSGTIVANPGWAAAPGIVAPGLVAARSVFGAPVVAAPAFHSAIAAPALTAGTVVAPGTTLVGPSTNGAPGAVINHGVYGSQILI